MNCGPSLQHIVRVASFALPSNLIYANWMSQVTHLTTYERIFFPVMSAYRVICHSTIRLEERIENVGSVTENLLDLCISLNNKRSRKRCRRNGRTHGRTHGRTNPSYRGACTHLKRGIKSCPLFRVWSWRFSGSSVQNNRRFRWSRLATN